MILIFSTPLIDVTLYLSNCLYHEIAGNSVVVVPLVEVLDLIPSSTMIANWKI